MAEQEYDIKTVQVECVCDECCKGHMEITNQTTIKAYPAQYEHRCDNCGHFQNYTVVYPFIKYISVKKEPHISHETARECVEDMDDYARMEMGIEPIGPYKALHDYINQQEGTNLKEIQECIDSVALP